MSDQDQDGWRTAKGKGRGRGKGRQENWRNKNDGETEIGSAAGRSRFFQKHFNKNESTSSKPISQQTDRRTENYSQRQDANSSSNTFLDQVALQDLVEKQTVEQVTQILLSPYQMKQFSEALSMDLSEDIFVLLFKLIAKACENTFVTSKSYVLKNIMQKKFITVICNFFSGLLISENADPIFWENIDNLLDCVLILLENTMQLIPLTCWEQAQTITKSLTLILPVLLQNKKITVSAETLSRLDSIKQELVIIENKFKNPKIKLEISADVRKDEPEPQDDYRYLDIYPSTEELIIPEQAFVRKNIINGKYPSLRDYLDIHFRLMREDFLRPIREDVCDFLNNTNRHLFNIKIHKNVVFLQRDIIGDTVAYKAKFQLTKGLENMLNSGQNKRFMHGSLLLFSDDNFKSLFCGKIVGSDNVRDGHLLVTLHEAIIQDYSKKYTMIECIIFFEPYYQVLNVIQQLSVRSLPMEKYIINVETNISRPKYMDNVRGYELPTNLNPSQTSALNAALNKEFVIIQGPPGTGKTFLGMQLIKMILSFKQHCHLGPVVIITFTNHALEQFLQGLSSCTDKIVRLGRGSNDLRLMQSKFGVNAKFREFLINDGYLEHDFISDGHIEKLMRILYYGRESKKRDPFEDLPLLESITASDVPRSIMLEIRDKMLRNNEYKNIKCVEKEISEIKSDLNELFYIEPQGISFEMFFSKIQESFLGGTTLLEWLLFDDGTILFTKKENIEKPNQVPDPLEEENNINHLCNFVFQNPTLEAISHITIETLEKKSKELHDFIKMEKGLSGSHRKFLWAQLDFLLKKIDYLRNCLGIEFEQPQVNFNDFYHPFMIPSINRWQLYKSWFETHKANLRMKLDFKLNELRLLYAGYKDRREMGNVKLLNEMDIIGMTTTCAARNRSMLEAIQSRIVLVEEAAEVLESHIVTALTTNCQHLILLGDHQQLKPTTSDYTVDRKCKLGISLFERMILNNVECHTLNVQHRMRPEISSLISPVIYKELYNNRSVEMYPTVSGVTHSLFFIDHIEPEEPYGDSSKKNVHEAKFLIQLAIYLLNNNYKASEITILAAYLGQMYQLKDEQKKHAHQNLQDVRIAVVDNFQGEENKIILLSLVRNNPEKKIGFLATDNRVCVALSRAKEGFYVMGNMEHLCNGSEIWKTIRSTLEAQQALGKYLTLKCKIHQEHMTFVSKGTDFAKVPEGGCSQVCNTVLKCGHNCTKICHGYDLDHELYNCKYKCEETLCDDPAHKCKKLCFEKCGSCTYTVQRILPCGHKNSMACHVASSGTYDCKQTKEIHPECGHVQDVTCSLEMNEFKCQVEVEHTLECQHVHKIPCSQEVNSFICKEEVERKLICGHTQKMACSQDIDSYICRFESDITLQCGHKWKRQCGHVEKVETRNLMPQLYRLQARLQIQTEQCREACTKNLQSCNDPEAHGKCDQLCSQPCRLCTKRVSKSYTECSHFEILKCCDANPYRKCSQRCSKKLACGHFCTNKCSELCTTKCSQYGFKAIPECGHKIKVMCRETPLQKNCQNPCKKFLNCGHACKKNCNEVCSEICVENCNKVLNCGHACITKCNKKCACKIEIIPECGHSIQVECGEKASQENCQEECRKILPCGHQTLRRVKCNTAITEKCHNRCEKLLECGHPCIAKCGEPCSVCREPCTKTIACGHPCQTLCFLPCTDLTRCLFPCDKPLACGHKCQEKCYQTYTVSGGNERRNCSGTCVKNCELWSALLS
ncbi:unnamed protein product [Ceutorhynchus assimilis]|uniref:NF-X1-type domain-containing protein n=1 Tax=Ceutorhynchus assimilis TaxID=467358 RepID=A0A9N9QR99_9CUCU|nr:unnamed protein product [Ceutorhynchus assimilis]